MKEELDAFSYHEALDRTHSVNVMIDELLVDHPVIEKYRDIKLKIYMAQQLLAGAYQMIGEISIEKFE